LNNSQWVRSFLARWLLDIISELQSASLLVPSVPSLVRKYKRYYGIL